MIVMDASAAINIVRGTVEGKGLRAFMSDRESVLAPHLFVAEAANGFRTLVHARQMGSEDALSKLAEALKLVDEFFDDVKLMPEALHEALAHNHPVYDMLYLVLARRENATLFTCDRKLVKLCESLGIDCIHFETFDDELIERARARVSAQGENAL